MMSNHCLAFSVCFYVIITILARYNEISSVGTLW